MSNSSSTSNHFYNPPATFLLFVCCVLMLSILPQCVSGQSTTTTVPCCPPLGPGSFPDESCTITIDAPTTSDQVAVAQNCNHPSIGIVLRFKSNATKFVLRNSKVKHVTLEPGASLQDVHASIESTELYSVVIDNVRLTDSTLAVNGSTINSPLGTSMGGLSAVRCSSTTLTGDTSIQISSSSVSLIAGSDTYFISLDKVVATQGSSIVINDVKATVISTSANATMISIGHSILSGFVVNVTSCSFLSNSGGAAGVLTVDSSAISGGTQLVFESITGTSRSIGFLAAAFGIQLSNVRAEPSDDKPDESPLEISFKGTLSAHCESSTGKGVGANLFHIHDSTLRGVAIRGYGMEQEGDVQAWNASSASQDARSSLYLFQDVQGRNVTLSVENAPLSISSKGHATTLMLVDDVALTDLDVTLSGVDLTLTSSLSVASLLFIHCTAPKQVQLVNPTMRIGSQQRSSSLPQSMSKIGLSSPPRVVVEADLNRGCLVMFVGAIANTTSASSIPPLWRNLVMDIRDVDSFQCISFRGENHLINTEYFKSAAPIGTAVTFKHTNVSATADGSRAFLMMFYLNGITTNLSVSFDSCTVYARSRESYSIIMNANHPGTMRSHELVTITNSTIRLVAQNADAMLVYMRGTLEANISLVFQRSKLQVVAKDRATLLYQLTEKVGDAQRPWSSLSMSIVDCEYVSQGAYTAVAQAVFQPHTTSISTTILRSRVYLHSTVTSHLLTLTKSEEHVVPPSPSVLRIEGSFIELDGGQSLVLTGHPSQPPLMYIESHLLNSTFRFYRRQSSIINFASIVHLSGMLNTNVQIHSCDVAVLGFTYRGAQMITLGGEHAPHLPGHHRINITRNSFKFEIARTVGRGTENFVHIVSVSSVVGPTAVVARENSIDYSSAFSSVRRSFFQFYNCTPDCEIIVTDLNGKISTSTDATSYELSVVTGSNALLGEPTNNTKISVENVKLNVLQSAGFFGIRLWGAIAYDTKLWLRNFTASSPNPKSTALAPVTINVGEFHRLYADIQDVSVDGEGWYALLLLSTVASTYEKTRKFVDSTFNIRNVQYQSQATNIGTRRLDAYFIRFSKGRDLQNSTVTVADTTIDISTRTDCFFADVSAHLAAGSSFTVDNVTVELGGTNIILIDAVENSIADQSTVRVSDVSVQAKATSLFRPISFTNSYLLSGSSFRIHRLDVTSNVSSDAFMFDGSLADSSTAFTLQDSSFDISGKRSTTLGEFKNANIQSTLSVSNVQFDAASAAGSAYLFYAFNSSVRLLSATNIKSSWFSATARLCLCAFTDVGSSSFHSTISLVNLSFPNVVVGYQPTPSPSASGAHAHEQTYRYLSILQVTRSKNINVVFDRLAFNGSLSHTKDNYYFPLFYWSSVTSVAIQVQRSLMDFTSTNTTVELVRFTQTRIADSLISFEDATVTLRSELQPIFIVFQSPSLTLIDSKFSVVNSTFRCTSGGNYILAVYNSNNLVASSGDMSGKEAARNVFIRFDSVRMELYFLVGNQRSPVAQRLGDNGNGHIAARHAKLAIVGLDTAAAIREGHHPVMIEFANIGWITRTFSAPTAPSTSHPNVCMLYIGLSKNIHLLFNNIDMQCYQRTSTVAFTITGHRYNSPPPPLIPIGEVNPHVSNVTILNSNFHITTLSRLPRFNLTIDDNVSSIFAYEIGFPAIVDVTNTTMIIEDAIEKSPTVPKAPQRTMLWSWLHRDANSTVTNGTSPWMPFPRITFRSSSFTNIAHAILPPAMSSGSRPVPATEYPHADIRINCTWLNGKRLTAPYFSTALPTSAISYHPALVDQEHLLCPISGTTTPSPTSSPSASSTVSTTSTLNTTSSDTISHTLSVTASTTTTFTPESTTTTTTSLNESSTASTTLLDALPWCRHAHIQMVVVEEGSEAQTMLELDREVEADSAYRNVSAARVSLSTLNDATVLAYLFLTNDTAASWTSLAVEAGRVRVVCGSGTEADDCGSSLREAEAARPVSAELVSAFLLRLRLGAWGALYLGSSGVLEVRVSDAAVGCSELGAGEYVQELFVDVAAKADEAVQAAATSTIAAASVVGAAASPAMLMDAQSLATFSLISCSSGSDRYAMQQAMFLLSPFSLGPEPEGFVWTNLMFLSVLLVPFVTVIAFWRLREPGEGYVGACLKARFPSTYFSISMIFHQGTAVLSMRMLFDGRWSAASVIGTLWSLLFPLLIYVTYKRKVSRDLSGLVSNDMLVFFRYDEEVSWSWPDNVLVRWLKRYAFPVGRWGPSRVRRRFGGPISMVLPTWTVYATLPLVQAVLVSFVASIQAGSTTGCMAQYAVLTLFFVFFGIAVSLLQPFRAKLLNTFQAASYFLLASILACSAALAFSSRYDGARTTLSAFMIFQLILSIVRSLYVIPLKIGEILWWSKYAAGVVYNALRDDERNSTLFYEALGVDEEFLMQQEHRKQEVQGSAGSVKKKHHDHRHEKGATAAVELLPVGASLAANRNETKHTIPPRKKADTPSGASTPHPRPPKSQKDAPSNANSGNKSSKGVFSGDELSLL